MARRRYSELECFTLGLVWQLGPCSPYDVRRHMLGSPSTQWSASAGSIYPLMQRLAGRGLLRAAGGAKGKRRRKAYAVTPAGMKVLREWVGPPLGAEAVTAVYDPLRSRARFLGVLGEGERRRWVAAAEESLAEVARRISRWDEVYAGGNGSAGRGGGVLRLMTRHGELDLAARRRWLREVGKAVGGGGKGG